MARLSGGRRRALATAATALLALAGAGALAVGLAGQERAPRLAASADGPSLPVAPTRAPAPAPSGSAVDGPVVDGPVVDGPVVDGPVLPESQPVSLTIPAIDAVSPSVVTLGLNPDRTMEVPQDYDLAGWYRHGPTPGELGPSVIAGHVDSAKDGPAVFFRLAELEPGNEIHVERADGTTAVFAVDRLEQYPKDAFATEEVYGELDHAGLRLITCGGTFDDGTGHYRDNLVVFAHLVKSA